jgi:phosphinothricin acetyltransferase
MEFQIIELSRKHRKQVLAVVNHFVKNSFAAFPEEPATGEYFDRLLAHCRGYPALAAEAEGRIVGFALLRPYHSAATLRRTAEITYFLLPAFTRQGAGSRMLEVLTERARVMGVWNLIATVSSLNPQSLQFHQRSGFTCCGTIRSAGRKFDQDFDLVLFQKQIG